MSGKSLLYAVNGRFPSERAYMNQVVQMCHAFTQTGMEVTLIANTRVTSITENPDDYYGFPILFKVKKVWVAEWMIANRFTYLMMRFFFALQIVMLLKQRKPDIFYCRDEWIVWFVSFFHGANKIIWESHEAKINYAARSILNSKIFLVVISEGIRDFYVQQNLRTSNMMVAHDGIDDSFFDVAISKSEAQAKLGLAAEKPIVMYIGKFDEWKGVRIFCAASEYAQNFQFVAIGGVAKEIQQFKKDYPRVIFLGTLPYRDLKYNQQAADILVIPNTTSRKVSSEYTSPLKLFAHMSSGIPLILSDVNSLRVVVADELANWCKAGSPEHLAQTIRRVWSAYDDARTRAGILQKSAIQYTWNKRSINICTNFFERT